MRYQYLLKIHFQNLQKAFGNLPNFIPSLPVLTRSWTSRKLIEVENTVNCYKLFCLVIPKPVSNYFSLSRNIYEYDFQSREYPQICFAAIWKNPLIQLRIQVCYGSSFTYYLIPLNSKKSRKCNLFAYFQITSHVPELLCEKGLEVEWFNIVIHVFVFSILKRLTMLYFITSGESLYQSTSLSVS